MYGYYGYQQPQQQKGITGRYVATAAEITPNEVAMDGSVSLFPTNDLSMIFAKAWRADGTIQTIMYKPVAQEEKQSMDDRLGSIEARLEKLERGVADE